VEMGLGSITARMGRNQANYRYNNMRTRSWKGQKDKLDVLDKSKGQIELTRRRLEASDQKAKKRYLCLEVRNYIHWIHGLLKSFISIVPVIMVERSANWHRANDK
jgi:hypothetical protein